MRFSNLEIRRELTDNWQDLEDARDPEDLLPEWADSAVPIYTNEIIRDWQEMPSEFNDSWKDGGFDSDSGIVSLMRIDLYYYYTATYQKIYAEILAEREEGNE